MCDRILVLRHQSRAASCARSRSTCRIRATAWTPRSARWSTHLCRDDRAPRPRRARTARDERFPGTGIGTDAAAGLDQPARRPDRGGGAAALSAASADLPEHRRSLQLEIDELFPVAETLQMLRFAEVEGGDIRLTEAGKRFADADVDDAQAPVRPASAGLSCRWPPTSAACSTSAPTTRRRSSRFCDELEDHMSRGRRRARRCAP